MSVSAIIVAAGSSQRMGFDKLSALLDHRSILEHTLNTFLSSKLFSEIIVVCPKSRWDTIDSALREQLIQVNGGLQRHLSVANGLEKTNPNAELVAVHDAARPLITIKDLKQTINAARINGAACLAHPIVDTVKRSSGEHFIESDVSREDLWAMETPQIFQFELLKKAYQHTLEKKLTPTDETSVVREYGGKVKLVSSTSPNFKITHPEDLELAKKLIQPS